MPIAISLFHSWYLLPHPSGSGSKLCPHGSIVEIFPCPDLFPLCITSLIIWAHIFIRPNQFTGLSGFKPPFSHSLSSSQPFPKGQGQAERELLNQYCCGLNALWNPFGFPLQPNWPICWLFFCFLLGCRRFASPNTGLTSTSKYSRTRVHLAWEFLFTLFAAIHALWTCLLLESQEAWLWWEWRQDCSLCKTF